MVLLIGLSVPWTATLAAKVPLRCPDDGAIAHTELVNVTKGITLIGADPRSMFVEVEERGERLVAREEDPPWLSITVPLRYALHAAPLAPRDRRTLLSSRTLNSEAVARITVRCPAPTEDDPRMGWLREAAALATEIDRPKASISPSELIDRAERLRAAAVPGRDRAISLHLLAQAHLDVGASAVAAGLFREAEAAWLDARDPERALVARLAWIEDLFRSARYEQVLANLNGVPAVPGHARYFAVRIANVRCLTLLTLGRREDARTCYLPNARAFGEIGEPIEWAATLVAIGYIERDLGNFVEAAAVVEKALRLPDGPGVDIVRGRAHTLLADVAVLQGQPGAALEALSDALAAQERGGDLRAQANTLLRVADLYRLLMAWNEAYESLALGLRLLSPADAPTRVAEGVLGLARLDLDAGRAGFAWTNAGRAQSLFERLGLAERAFDAALVRRQAALALGRVEPVAAIGAPPAMLASRAALVAALEAQHQGVHDEALRLLGSPPAVQGVDEAVQWRIARARSRAQSPAGTAAALDELSAAAALLAAAAEGSGNAVLRTLLLRRLDRVRLEGVELLAGAARGANGAWSEIPADRTAALRRWALGRSEMPPTTEGTLGERAAAFDRALAQELLGVRSAAPSDAPGALRLALAALTARETPSRRGAAFRWAPLDVPALEPGLAFLLPYAHGNRVSVVLFADGRAWMRDAGDARAAAAAVLALRQSLAQPAPTAGDPESLAAALSARLLGSEAPVPVPQRLGVVESPTFAVLPWALLGWPGAGRSLVDTTDIAMFDPGARASSPPSHDGGVHVLVASLHGARAGALPPLDNARSIGRRFRTLWPQDLAGLAVVDPAGRADLLRVLERPGVVHVAAHGMTQPGRLGSSGLWLQDAVRATPEFVGWFDVVSRPLSAGLLVLDACRTADDGGDPTAPGLAFANTAHRAGVAGVVSALWPVSDSASGVWLPAFYRSYAGAASARDVAAATRQAQLALRATRAYRHPFYWASLVYLGRFAT